MLISPMAGAFASGPFDAPIVAHRDAGSRRHPLQQWRSCRTPQNRFKKPAPIAPGPSRVRRLAQTLRFPQRRLEIRDDVTVHRHANLPFGTLDSETITKGNPESQQALGRAATGHGCSPIRAARGVRTRQHPNRRQILAQGAGSSDLAREPLAIWGMSVEPAQLVPGDTSPFGHLWLSKSG